MAVSSSDVPGRYDLVIDVGGTKTGYIFDETIDPQARLFGKKKAAYSYSPTFVERQNVSGSYGDDQQDFWLTSSQDDWSLGEDQKFFRGGDEDSRRRYWQGVAVDVRTPGQVSMREAVKSVTAAANPQCAIGQIILYFATSTNLYSINSAGTVTDLGAHGLGASPASPNGIATDVNNIYLTSEAGGSVGVRRYNLSGASFSTFSATKSSVLLFHNNTLYGMGGAGVFRRYDTGGTASTIYTFQDATGAAAGLTSGTKLLAFGPKVLIFRGPSGNDTVEGRAELWVYDGVGVSLLDSLQPNFYAYGVCVAEGVIFVLGSLQTPTGVAHEAVFYVANGTPGKLWESQAAAGHGGIAPHAGGVVWSDKTNGHYLYYNLATGGIHRFATAGTGSDVLAAGTYHLLGFINNSTSMDLFPDTVRPSSATVTSSLFDFDSSLDKLFRGVKVDFDSATDGNGGTVDIAYRVADVSGSYTTLQSGATSGTEYALTGVTGRNISVKITLNKGTSTNGPVLKRIYVRAVPVLQQKKLRQYTIACFGDPTDPNAIMRLRDGTPSPKTGREMADAINTAITSTTPITIYDRFTPAGFTAVLEPAQCDITEIHAEPRIPPSKSGSFIALITAREI